MTQITSTVENAILARQEELLQHMLEVRQTQAHHTEAILALGQRVNELESGMPRHDYTQSQLDGPRGASAPVSSLFGKELEISKPRSARTVSVGEAEVCEILFQDLRLREQYNRASKGGKALLFVWGPLQADKSRVQGPSMYWDMKNALDSDLLNGRKMTTDEVVVYSAIIALCEEVDPDAELPFHSTYSGATQRVKNFLKKNRK